MGAGRHARSARAGLSGAVTIAGRQFPQYDLFLIALGPAVFVLLHLLLTRTRFGILVRAATEDREMAALSA